MMLDNRQQRDTNKINFMIVPDNCLEAVLHAWQGQRWELREANMCVIDAGRRELHRGCAEAPLAS